MATLVILGLQWGDEGKGKIVDMLAERFDVVARYQGGHNAGHTVAIDDQRFVLHLIPSGILHPDTQCVIGNGVVMDPVAFFQEIDELQQRGLNNIPERLFVSARAHIILPYHRVLDQTREKNWGAKKIGTTGRGIGPAYESKMGRSGIVTADLLNETVFREKLRTALETVKQIGGEEFPELAYEPMCQTYLNYGEQLRPYLVDCSLFLRQAIKKGKHLLCEGAQGAMLDVDHGTYPYVTSSSACAGGACTGLGLGPTQINSVLGVIKAYTTRVGEGPFPTELFDDNGKTLRDRGNEYGATTGRPRRCGWFDAVIGRYAVRINDARAVAVMKLDVLDSFPKINICTGYRYRNDVITELPIAPDNLAACEPIYEEHEGWQQSTAGIEHYDDLPSKARGYLDRIAELLGTDIAIISTGPKRSQTIINKEHATFLRLKRHS